MRLAIAFGDLSDRALHPSQVADRPPSASPGKENKQAWRDHLCISRPSGHVRRNEKAPLVEGTSELGGMLDNVDNFHFI